MESTQKLCSIDEQSYCSPWDLKLQTELFNSLKTKFEEINEKPKPDLSSINNDSEPLSFQAALFYFHQLTESKQTETAYEKPWNNEQMLILEKSNDLHHQQWFHPEMSRREAELILKARPPGSFLVRQSETGSQNDYSLSIRMLRTSIHMRISHSSGSFILGECSRPFSSLSKMIDYFSHVSVPIRGASHIKLTVPVRRCELGPDV